MYPGNYVIYNKLFFQRQIIPIFNLDSSMYCIVYSNLELNYSNYAYVQGDHQEPDVF